MFGLDNNILPILLLLLLFGGNVCGRGDGIERRDGFREEFSPCCALLLGIAAGSLCCGNRLF